MKKKYAKPSITMESMELQSTAIRTCSDAGNHWAQMEMGEDDDGNPLIVYVEEIGCNISDKDYMNTYGGVGDGSCLYAYTDDGKTFNS